MIRPTGIINFAVGEWAMVGAFGGYLVLAKVSWPYPLGFVAALMGINLSRVTALSFGAGGVVAGLAGLLIGPNISAHYLMGVPLAIQGFTALVIGGVGRVEGALLGGLLLAFAEQLTVRYAPIPSGYAQGVQLVFLLVILVFRLTGLLRAREAKA